MKTKTLLVVVVGCLLVISSGCSFFKDGPAETVTAFYRAVEAGKVSDAISLLSPRVIQTVGEEKLKQGISQQTRDISNKGGIQAVDILKEDVIGETADVTVKITFGNGQTTTETAKLIQEDGDWKIDLSK